MPLHLLGKKSWNVYNADNIARVRRDEAAAADREAAEEQRMQEEDAARRLAILRGEEPLPLTSAGIDTSAHDEPDNARPRRGLVPERCRRKRKRPDEDDTEFEMRVVRENAESNAVASHGLLDGHRSGSTPKGEKSALTDVTGLFSLFDDGVFEKSAPRNSMKKEEAEEGVAKKTREAEDQYQMLFANAAGRDGAGITDGGPWSTARGIERQKSESVRFMRCAGKTDDGGTGRGDIMIH
ncbi:hypothetical protein P8C59_005444 [Phyllachora maydis]|uniref:CBF1-interacting co-repressor CIR N-terminal domain-containing protein n=1 Tax=Phyllachora maydis TaxID=1825666 RepID=A0AAD9I642_9PEZI|nr:hypothetical protein P8C59_005444 [Phyllachora maydis]